MLRILDRQAVSDEAHGLSLDVLGFDPAIMARFRLLAEEPYGMLLVTGPTGSGKTTTLYGIISEINTDRTRSLRLKIRSSTSFTACCRSPSTRKRPDARARPALYPAPRPGQDHGGEIRDGETAQIAVQSALTGHLVLTTVHANNVFDVIGRFTNMGVDLQLRFRHQRHPGPATGAGDLPPLRRGRPPLARAAEEVGHYGRHGRRFRFQDGPGVRPMPRHRLSWPQGDCRIAQLQR